MSLLSRIFSRAPAVAKSGSVSLAWPSPQLFGMFGTAASSTGVPVTPLSALQVAAVYACVKCLAEDIAKLPLALLRGQADGNWHPDRAHPVARLLACPNRWQTPFDFWSFLVVSLMLRGNAFAAIRRGANGSPDMLIPISWDRVSVMLSPEGWLYYNISHPQIGFGVTLHQDDVLHVRNISVDGGYLGISPIAAAQDVIGLALATQQHGAVLFRQGTNLTGVLKAAKSLSPEAATRLAQSWRDIYGGVQNAAKVAVLEEGMDFQKIQMTAEESQFLGTRQFQIPEICRLFRVPPHKIQDLSRATFSNIENQAQQYIDDALQPIAVRIEQACARVLLFDDERPEMLFRFEFEELLRGDFKTRMEGYAVAINTGVMNPNEARRRERLNPYDGGDTFRTPLNMAAAGVAAPTGQSSVPVLDADHDPDPDADIDPASPEALSGNDTVT